MEHSPEVGMAKIFFWIFCMKMEKYHKIYALILISPLGRSKKNLFVKSLILANFKDFNVEASFDLLSYHFGNLLQFPFRCHQVTGPKFQYIWIFLASNLLENELSMHITAKNSFNLVTYKWWEARVIKQESSRVLVWDNQIKSQSRVN